jgi:hypothetical protein
MEKGFYKFEDNNLFFAPNFIFAPTYELYAEMKNTYNYPIEGWYWFESKNDAIIFFNIEEENFNV